MFVAFRAAHGIMPAAAFAEIHRLGYRLPRRRRPPAIEDLRLGVSIPYCSARRSIFSLNVDGVLFLVDGKFQCEFFIHGCDILPPSVKFFTRSNAFGKV